MPDERDEGERSARPFWSGTITFGLVSIPVNLFTSSRGGQMGLRMLGPNGKPLARRYFSEKSGRRLDDDDIVRGYEIKEGKYVEITDEELERLEPIRSRDINLQRFVEESSIPRLYFERGYYLAPAGSTRAYQLLAETMERTRRAGIATFVMRGKEYLIAITAENGVLRAETMRFSDEVRSPKTMGLGRKQKPAPAAVKSFERIITQRAATRLAPGILRNREEERLMKVVSRKRRKKENVVAVRGRGKQKAEVVDLLEVLRKNLRMAG